MIDDDANQVMLTVKSGCFMGIIFSFDSILSLHAMCIARSMSVLLFEVTQVITNLGVTFCISGIFSG